MAQSKAAGSPTSCSPVHPQHFSVRRWGLPIFLALLAALSIETAGALEQVEGRVLVRFKESASKTALTAIYDDLGVTKARKLASSDYEILDIGKLTTDQALQQFGAHPDILEIEPDYYAIPVGVVPNDPFYLDQWEHRNSGQSIDVGGVQSIPDADTDADEAWCITRGSPDGVLAVIDTGVLLDHEDLAGRIWTNPGEVLDGTDTDGNGFIDDLYGWDFTNDDNDPNPVQGSSQAGHGTFVTGVAVAVQDNAVGVSGIAPDSRVMALRAYSGADHALAIDYAVANGADVVNLSWTYCGARIAVVESAIGAAGAAGVLCIIAAGNNECGGPYDLDVTPLYPPAYPDPLMVVVNASTTSDIFEEVTYGINWGLTTVDIAAPGHRLHSTTYVGDGDFDEYSRGSGTSFAAPMTGGAALLVKSLNPTISIDDLRSAILDNADPLPSYATRNVTGGRLNAWASVAGYAPADTVAPANIVDLSVASVAEGTVSVEFTTPGDDDLTGQACCLDVRYSTTPIDAANFDQATEVPDEPEPLAPLTVQQVTVSNLEPNTTYYFAAKVQDELRNVSGISNVVSATTPLLPPVLTLSPAGTLVFVDVVNGDSAVDTLTVRNDQAGSAPMDWEVTNINVPWLAVEPSSGQLAAEESIPVQITASTDYLSGTVFGQITFRNQTVGVDHSVTVVMIVVSAPAIVVADPNLNYPVTAAGQGSRLGLSIENVGALPLVVDSLTSSSGLFEAELPFFLLPAQSADLNVTFWPDTIEVVTDQLVIHSNATVNPQVPVEATGTAVKFGATLAHTWTGTVVLQSDVLVGESLELTVEPGTTVLAQSDGATGTNHGKDPSLVEVVVRGTLSAEGDSSAPITFTSTGDDQIGADHWGGLLFELGGSYDASYGYFASLVPVSRMESAAIENAEYGVRIADRIAPGLKDMTFSGIALDRHVFLDNEDVVIPAMRSTPAAPFFTPDAASWQLAGPTQVFASNGSGSVDDSPVGHAERVDLIVQGDLHTTAGPSGEFVGFRTALAATSESDSWGGILLDEETSASSLDRAEIEFATTAIHMFHPDGSSLTNSWVHDFFDVGVHIEGTGDGATIRQNTIERGAVADTVGNECLVLENADEVLVELNEIRLGPIADNGELRSGIRIQSSKAFCASQMSPPQNRSQILRENWVVGPGAAAADPATGLRVHGACGDSYRNVLLEENWVESWPEAGVDFQDCVDVQVTCNVVKDSELAVEFGRPATTTGPPVRLLENRLESPSGASALIRTNNALKLKLGAALISTKGLNQLRSQGGADFILENDPDTTRTLDARSNFWFIDGALEDVQANVEALIATDIATGPEVNITGFRIYPDPQPCAPSQPPAAGSSASMAKAPLEIAGDAHGGTNGTESEPGAALSTLPLRTTLGRPVPNPTRGVSELELTIAPEQAGAVRVEIYDVGGRRVGTLVDRSLVPGHYRLEWSGRDRWGRLVAPGIYFVQLIGNDIRQTRKVTRLH